MRTRGKVIFRSTGFNIGLQITSFNIQMTSFSKITKVSVATIRQILKLLPLILEAYNKYYGRKLLLVLDILNVFLNKIKIVCESWVLHKNTFFFHIYILKKYFKDQFTLLYICLFLFNPLCSGAILHCLVHRAN